MMNKALCVLLAIAGLSSPTAQAQSVQVGFSPEGSARSLVLDVINHAHKSIKMMAYEFLAPDIVSALDAAVMRGVAVQVVVDNRENMHNKQALRNLADASRHGITLRVDKHYRIQHDKVIITDDSTVETGSFNYSTSAEAANSENVVVLRSMPEVTKRYQHHFAIRWSQSQDLR